MTRALAILTLAAMLTACATTAKGPEMVWVRADGVSMAGRPDLLGEFETAILVCRGKRQEALVLAPEPENAFSIPGMHDALDEVARGCMAERGFLLRPTDSVGEVGTLTIE